ncbi:MAG: hypothetical protein IKA61_06440 [Clostridia bacterium]|nr:hypothetical protein [Clostridia bacterium]
MKSYILSIIVTSVAIALSELILPQGRLKPVVSTAFSLALLFCVISPLKNTSDFGDISAVLKNEPSVVTPDVSQVNTYFDGRIEKYYQSVFKNQLLNNSLVAEEVIVETDNLKIIKVKIFLSNLVIPEENSHIDNNVIANYVAEILGVEQSKVEIYA